MAQKVVVFIDYQNVKEDARRAFYEPSDFHTRGQFDPLNYGKLICSKKPKRKLKEVRVYTGLPASSKDPQGYAARRRQIAYWKKIGVTVKPRTLRYPPGWPDDPEHEKGVDVALAVDFVAMAVREEYDIGVISTTDTDLRPAIEFVATLDNVIAEEAAWWNGFQKQLSLPESHVWCHRLNKEDYEFAADFRDYNLSDKEIAEGR
ncbi:MAG: NYN domain-containing protein [Chloroflexi bacterium]|nr:NYN domain-containing protein [Chloroflexota bacterium]